MKIILISVLVLIIGFSAFGNPISIATFERKINTKRFDELLENSDVYFDQKPALVSISSVRGVKSGFSKNIAM